jgi:competence protein ComEC
MSKAYHIHIWKKAPFLRLILPLITGILLQFFCRLKTDYIIAGAISFSISFILFGWLPEAFRFKFAALRGIIISLFLVCMGSFLTWQKDVRNNETWYGNIDTGNSFLIVTINEPPVEKAKSYKALVRVESIVINDSPRVSKGDVLVYFSKDPLSAKLKYGDRIVLRKPLQPIKNSGNPGGFNYAQYLAFQQIYHQVYLKKNDWRLLKGNNTIPVKSALFTTRDYVIKTIEKYITGENESALAKALLIGYRVDLDKDLVQAYSNAGVVHLIAISGLHLALIYGLLYWIALKIPYLKNAKIPRTVIILFCLWAFAFLTGAPPSVMRAAVMFSFISVGSVFEQKSSIYNSLCVSAFVLLCFDPYLFWNVGFQLSYLAVLGIVVLQKPIYNWLYFKNKILDYTWQMASVSIAAQIFTIPACFYYFHQLPLLFLVANLIAIPLATVALWGCIGLIALSPITILAFYFGKATTAFLWLMNHSILLINQFPFALWENVFISVWATLLLYLIFISFIFWLVKKNMAALKLALLFSLLFTANTAFNKWQSFNQKRMIVYNIPLISAVDFIIGNEYLILADSSLHVNKLLKNFHVKPAHISLSANKKVTNLEASFEHNNFYRFFNKNILIIDSAIHYLSPQKIVLDYIIIAKNPKIKIADLLQTFDCKQFIFTSSNSLWKIDQWKKECEELHLHSHSVAEQGAFVTDL